MRISDWSSDVCSSDLKPEKTPGSVGHNTHGDRRSYLKLYFAVNFCNRSKYRSASPSTSRSSKIPCASSKNATSFRSPANSSASTVRNASSRSEERTSELQSLMRTSYAVFCLQQKKNVIYTTLTLLKHIDKYKKQDNTQ